MLVIAIHMIHDVDKFAAAASPSANPIPEELTLHYVIPSSDGLTAICLWEGPAKDAVTQWVEDTVGRYCTNHLFEVDRESVQWAGV